MKSPARRTRTAVAGLLLGVTATVGAGWTVDQVAASSHAATNPSRPAAGPHVLPFAAQVTGPPVAVMENRPARVPIAEGSDGCDHAYGDLGQCVPWRFPAGVRDGCDWLRAHGFGSLTVHGRDRHRLDTDADGVACGLGDASTR